VKSNRIEWNQSSIDELKRALGEGQGDDEEDLEQESTLDYPWVPEVVSQSLDLTETGTYKVSVVLGFDDIEGAEDYEVRITLLPEDPFIPAPKYNDPQTGFGEINLAALIPYWRAPASGMGTVVLATGDDTGIIIAQDDMEGDPLGGPYNYEIVWPDFSWSTYYTGLNARIMIIPFVYDKATGPSLATSTYGWIPGLLNYSYIQDTTCGIVNNHLVMLYWNSYAGEPYVDGGRYMRHNPAVDTTRGDGYWCVATFNLSSGWPVDVKMLSADVYPSIHPLYSDNSQTVPKGGGWAPVTAMHGTDPEIVAVATTYGQYPTAGTHQYRHWAGRFSISASGEITQHGSTGVNTLADPGTTDDLFLPWISAVYTDPADNRYARAVYRTSAGPFNSYRIQADPSPLNVYQTNVAWVGGNLEVAATFNGPNLEKGNYVRGYSDSSGTIDNHLPVQGPGSPEIDLSSIVDAFEATLPSTIIPGSLDWRTNHLSTYWSHHSRHGSNDGYIHADPVNFNTYSVAAGTWNHDIAHNRIAFRDETGALSIGIPQNPFGTGDGHYLTGTMVTGDDWPDGATNFILAGVNLVMFGRLWALFSFGYGGTIDYDKLFWSGYEVVD
jgi:hypothetical protein